MHYVSAIQVVQRAQNLIHNPLGVILGKLQLYAVVHDFLEIEWLVFHNNKQGVFDKNKV